jgi:hypothetical protein
VPEHGRSGLTIFPTMRRVKIFCPKCDYVPKPADQWVCVSSCGCRWHTFDTCGVCPKCGKNWEHTACPLCQQWSLHIDWYHEIVPNLESREKELTSASQPLTSGKTNEKAA